MKFRLFLSIALCAFVTSSMVYAKEAAPAKSLFLVTSNQGPGFYEPNQVVPMMENLILPGLAHMVKLQADKTILAGGIYAGGRGGAMILEASSSDEVDRIIHTIPMWPLLEWTVTPLASFTTRHAFEKENTANFKKMMVK